MPKEAIANRIQNSVTALTKRPEFEASLKEEKIAADGLVLVNNSFIYRQKLKTNKSPYYLGIPANARGVLDTKSPKVTDGLHINSDLKFVKTGAKASLVVDELGPSIDRRADSPFIVLRNRDRSSEHCVANGTRKGDHDSVSGR